MFANCLAVGCGGFIGSVLRYLCGFIKVRGAPLPIVTLGINIIGSFAIMFFASALLRTFPLDGRAMLLLRVGLCGGFTTFSTFSAETLALFERGHAGMAFLYALLSFALCLLAAFVGEVLGGFLASLRG